LVVQYAVVASHAESAAVSAGSTAVRPKFVAFDAYREATLHSLHRDIPGIARDRKGGAESVSVTVCSPTALGVLIPHIASARAGIAAINEQVVGGPLVTCHDLGSVASSVDLCECSEDRVVNDHRDFVASSARRREAGIDDRADGGNDRDWPIAAAV